MFNSPPDLPKEPTYLLKPTQPVVGFATFLRHSISQMLITKYRNINLLSIHYAFRPRVRIRLTLGGVAWPRNPWIFGGRDSHPPLATHAAISSCETSSAPCRYAFIGKHNALLPLTQKCKSINSVRNLSPVTFSAQGH